MKRKACAHRIGTTAERIQDRVHEGIIAGRREKYKRVGVLQSAQRKRYAGLSALLVVDSCPAGAYIFTAASGVQPDWTVVPELQRVLSPVPLPALLLVLSTAQILLPSP